MESPDGRWLYFTQDRGSSSIACRRPAPKRPLFDFHQKNYSRVWTVAGEGVYFAVASSNTKSAIKFFSF